MSVTEQDRERAIELMATIQADAQWLTSTRREPVDRIAEALADERDRARAPFLAVAAEYDDGSEWGTQTHPGHEIRDRIRGAAEDPQ